MMVYNTLNYWIRNLVILTIEMVYAYFQEFDAMLKNSIPEIQRCNLTNVVLQLLALEIDPVTFNFLDKPPKEVSGGGGGGGRCSKFTA
jgi:hypothetical protein